jgi:large subunit ribosomal protein L22
MPKPASAKNNFHLNESNLIISKITVDEGPKLKRWHPMSRGRAYPIEKKTSHITIVLDELKNKKESKKRARKKMRERQ